MSYFDVTILGCGSATPTLRHMPSCQAVRYRQNLMLVDCGEGAQLQMRRYGLSFAKVNHIFLSHLHGDHILGLPGLLSTMALHDVEGTVTVHTFARGIEVLRQLMNLVCAERPYRLEFEPVDPAGGIVMEDEHLVVEAFPLYHRVPCVGYIFREKKKLRHIDGKAVRFHGVPHYMMNAIKAGADFTRADGTVIPNVRLTKDADPAMSYAYCSDTAFDPRVAEAVRGVDTIYHEATYNDELAIHAAPRGHSTARDAGRIAALAGARTLVLGHYSKRIIDTAELAAQAAEEFRGTVIAGSEGLNITLI